MSNDDDVRLIDVALTVRSGSMDDWWLIEREHHDGRVWMEQGEYGYSVCCSSRITNADIEGTGDEMRAVAKAIRERGTYGARRCAVRVVDGRAEFCSPRNSEYAASVPLARADALADEIERTVSP